MKKNSFLFYIRVFLAALWLLFFGYSVHNWALYISLSFLAISFIILMVRNYILFRDFNVFLNSQDRSISFIETRLTEIKKEKTEKVNRSYRKILVLIGSLFISYSHAAVLIDNNSFTAPYQSIRFISDSQPIIYLKTAGKIKIITAEEFVYKLIFVVFFCLFMLGVLILFFFRTGSYFARNKEID